MYFIYSTSMHFIETRQLGLEPEWARKGNKLTVRALNKLLKTQAGDISPSTFTRTHCDCMFRT